MKAKEDRACIEGLTIEELSRVGDVLKLLAHPHRLKIVEVLSDQKEAPVHLIAERIGLPPAPTSQHLNRMRRAGILASHRKGKEVWYSVGDSRSLSILKCIRSKTGGV